MIGIYKIINLINSKVYVGQSKDIKKRLNNHKAGAFRESFEEYNTPIHQAIRKYGLDNFSFEVIEKCKIKELNDKEKYWIKEYKSFPPSLGFGYNQTPGGEQGFKLNGIYPYLDEITKLLKQSNLTQREISLKFNVTEEMIQGINTGRYWKRDDINYPIRDFRIIKGKKVKDNPESKLIHYCSICGQPVKYYKSNICKDCRIKQSKKEKPSYKQLLKDFYELQDKEKVAEKYKISGNLLRLWCHSYGFKPQQKKIYIQKYEEEFLGIAHKEKKHHKQVIQLDKDNNVIAIFKSKSEAARNMNVSDACINEHIKKQTPFANSFWKYKD